MTRVKYDHKTMAEWVSEKEIELYQPSAAAAEQMLQKKNGPGNDFLGWLDLPNQITQNQLQAY